MESVPVLRTEVVAYAAEQQVTEPPIGALKLALAEAINNTVVHAFRDRQPGTVTVSISIQPEANEVKVLVTDDGIGCRPNPNSPGLGLGMPLMASLAESMEVREGPDGAGTEICLTFRLPIAD